MYIQKYILNKVWESGAGGRSIGRDKDMTYDLW